MFEVPFERVAHLVTVPVRLNGRETTFVVDSGIGLTIVRDTVAGCVPTGESFTGRRMSGQAVTTLLGTATVGFAGEERTGVTVGLLDMSGFPDKLADVDGFLALATFPDLPLTVDYPRGVVSLARQDGGVLLPLEVEGDGPSICAHLPLALPDGRIASVEVDMGSDSLILDERFRDLGAADERRVDGVDETGYSYTRRFTTLPGRIHPAAAPHLGQDDPAVMFQSIIHDGLLGDGYLRRHVVTFDVAASELVLSDESRY